MFVGCWLFCFGIFFPAKQQLMFLKVQVIRESFENVAINTKTNVAGCTFVIGWWFYKRFLVTYKIISLSCLRY